MTVTQCGLAACAQLLPTDLTTLPGTVTTSGGSASVTTTVDLRDYLVVGDLVSFSDNADVVYGISAITSTTITLVNTVSGGTPGSGLTIRKCSFNIPDTASVPTQSNGAGTAGATNGSKAVTGVGTSYTTLFAAGDAITFSGDATAKAYVIKSVTDNTNLVLEQNYLGTTATGKSYQKANFSPRRHDTAATNNKGGRFGAVAIGTSATASGATDTGLGAEITSGGGQRRSGSNVTTYLESTDAGVSWKSTWQTTFTFTASFGVNELGVFNDPDANQGYCLLRQVFASQLDVVSTDVLNLKISLTHSATATATGVVSSRGLKEAAKLIMDPATTLGTDAVTGGSEPAGATTWAANQGTQFDTIALGSGTNAPALTDVALQTEVSASGTARVTGANVLGTIMRNADAANVVPFTFSTDTQTSFKGDTVQWRAVFSITGTIAIREQGVFNGSTAGDNDPASGCRMLIRQVFASNLNLVNTDTYTPVIRLQST